MILGEDGVDPRLTAFFAEGKPPARDPAFEAQVAARIRRARRWEGLTEAAPIAVAGLGVLWAMTPTAAHFAAPVLVWFAPAAPLAGAVALAGAALYAGWRLGWFDTMGDALEGVS